MTKESYKTGGDDLDDGLELDPDLLAHSDEEGSDGEHDEDADAGPDADAEDDPDASFAPLEGEEDQIAKSPIAEGKKRKVDQVDEEVEVAQAGDEGDKQAEKKRRKKEKEKERKAKKRQNAIDPSSANNAPTHLPTADLSSILLRSIRESYPSASAVELEDLVIPSDHLLPPPSYPSPTEDTDGQEAQGASFKALQARVQSLLKPLEKKKLANGAPRIIILSLSGLRCADVVRGVRDVKGSGEVAKLFAKHFKLADQVKYLEKTKVSIAVGTPARVAKLLTEGAIKITSDTVLLLDIAHQDSKTRTILTLPEVRDELWKSVFFGKARETLLGGGVRIGAF